MDENSHLLHLTEILSGIYGVQNFRVMVFIQVALLLINDLHLLKKCHVYLHSLVIYCYLWFPMTWIYVDKVNKYLIISYETDNDYSCKENNKVEPGRYYTSSLPPAHVQTIYN